MKIKYIVFAGLAVALIYRVSFAEDKPAPKDENDQISYSVGYQIGGDFKRQGVDFSPEMLVKGIRDAVSDTEPMMTPEEMSKTLVELKRKIIALQQDERKKLAENNRAEGNKFLQDNSGKEGVITLPSGLQYKVIQEGSGTTPKAADTVTVHYRGTFIDGTEFDSSYSRGKPATFGVDRVIKGWTEALQLMKEGATWRLFIPPDLAYGEQVTGRIGPNSTLVFDLDLISVTSGE